MLIERGSICHDLAFRRDKLNEFAGLARHGVGMNVGWFLDSHGRKILFVEITAADVFWKKCEQVYLFNNMLGKYDLQYEYWWEQYRQ